jgi:tRNA-dihydrouridine synthase
MMDYTDRHFRYFLRHSWLYTEMITSAAILYDDRAKASRITMPECNWKSVEGVIIDERQAMVRYNGSSFGGATEWL